MPSMRAWMIQTRMAHAVLNQSVGRDSRAGIT